MNWKGVMTMDIGFTGRTGEHDLRAFTGKNRVIKNEVSSRDSEVGFEELISAKSAQRVTERENTQRNLISGGGISGPTREEKRQFEEEQRAKKIRRAKYARIVEESTVKRKLQEMERNRMYYQESVKALPMSSTYQKRIRQAQISSLSNTMTNLTADDSLLAQFTRS